jgi:hypothetical protein
VEIGDLVRMSPSAGLYEESDLGLVTEVAAAYPADPLERDLLVTVLFSDGQETWYDWQLELMSGES